MAQKTQSPSDPLMCLAFPTPSFPCTCFPKGVKIQFFAIQLICFHSNRRFFLALLYLDCPASIYVSTHILTCYCAHVCGSSRTSKRNTDDTKDPKPFKFFIWYFFIYISPAWAQQNFGDAYLISFLSKKRDGEAFLQLAIIHHWL